MIKLNRASNILGKPMNFPTIQSGVIKQIGLLITLLSIAACTSMTERQKPAFNPQLVSSMVFSIENRPELLGAKLKEETISRQVTNNLAQWGYVFNQTDTITYSHRLSVTFGAIKHSSTPAGLSFSAGNSNPRALEFQKADVLPMTCSLMPKENPEQKAELTLEVMAEDYLHLAKLPAPHNELTEELINDVSTSCYNLLSHLQVATQNQPQQDSKTIQPSWIPEIRVEIENDEKQEPMLQQPVKSERHDPKPAPRKKIIIHNQGTPVIFKFGHERK